MFFSGFFCGFERCGSPIPSAFGGATGQTAAISEFRGGLSSSRACQGVKAVRTNSRILHQIGNIKDSDAAERSEANLSNLQFPTWCIFTVRLETILLAALCAANEKVGQFSESQILVRLFDEIRTYFERN